MYVKAILNQQCHFCSQNIENIDYKDSNLLKKFVSGQGKIVDPRYTKTCSRHQRALATAIKRARFLALIPFVKR